jgi:hypothetical protein
MIVTNVEDFRYFFCAYSIGGNGMGNKILLQKKQDDGKPDRGFNLAAATLILIQQFGVPVIIVNWQELRHERYLEWLTLMNHPEVKKFCDTKCSEPSLGIVQGGGKKTEKAAPALKAVEPPSEEKTT